jgi:FkbM family methyltransferase
MVQIAELLAPGGTGILTCDYNDQYKPGDRIPAVDFRLYTQKDFKQRLLPLLKNCVLPDVPQWDCPNPDFIYEGCRYTFATFVFKKLDREAEIEAGNSNMTLNLPHNSEITSLYQRIIGRIPDADELVHWNVFLDAGCNLNEVEMSLLTSYEYEQKKVIPQQELIDLQKFKIYVMNNDLDVGVGIIRSKVYEPHITHIFEQLLKSGSTFLDIGANIGYYTLLAASLVGDVGQVLSFEPNFQNLQLLYSSILENKFQNIVVYPFAASDSHELLKLKSFGSNGFLEPPSYCQSNLQLVQSIRVDDLLQSVRQINLVKIDIEGYEPLAIAGMDKLLRNYRPIIISEYSPWHIQHRCQRNPEDYLKQLASYNYRLHIIDGSARITPMPDTASVINYWQSLNNNKINLDIIAQPL